MVEYHNNQAPARDNTATMFFIFLAIVVVVLLAIYVVPRLMGNTDSGSRDIDVQLDTPLPSDNGGTGDGGTGGTGGTGSDTGGSGTQQ